MSRDYAPVNDKSIADVQRANDEFYSGKDEENKEYLTRQAETSGETAARYAKGETRVKNPKAQANAAKQLATHAAHFGKKALGQDDVHAGSSRRLHSEKLREGEQGRDEETFTSFKAKQPEKVRTDLTKGAATGKFTKVAQEAVKAFHKGNVPKEQGRDAETEDYGSDPKMKGDPRIKGLRQHMANFIKSKPKEQRSTVHKNFTYMPGGSRPTRALSEKESSAEKVRFVK